MIKDLTFGSLLREIRIKNKETLRGYCQKRSFDPGNISRLERNMIAPPETIEQLLRYLDKLKYSTVDLDFLRTACVNYYLAKVIYKLREPK